MGRRLGFLLAVAGAAGAVFWLSSGDAAPPAPTPAATADTPPTPPSATGTASPSREAVAAPPATLDPAGAPEDATATAPPTVAVTGRCIADETGAPLPGCRIRCGNATAAVACTTGADGRFTIALPIDQHGAGEVTIDGDDRVPRTGRLVMLRAGAEEALGDVRLRRGHRVSGQVVDAQGQGVAGHNVVVFGIDTALRPGMLDQSPSSAICAADGRFTLDLPLPAGDHRAFLYGPQRLAGDGRFRVDPALGTPPLRLVVATRTTIHGTVQDARGTPLYDVALRTADGRATARSEVGRFTLTWNGAADGATTILLAEPAGWSPQFAPVPAVWGGPPVTVVLPDAAQLRVRATDEGGAPVDGFRVHYHAAGGFALEDDVAAKADGVATVPLVRAGTVRLRVVPDDRALLASERESVEVAPGATAERTVALARLRETTIEVVAGDGQPIAAATVDLVRSQRNSLEVLQRIQTKVSDRQPRYDGPAAEVLGTNTTDAQGRTTLLAPADTTNLLLRVRAGDYIPRLVLAPPLSPASPLRVVLDRSGSLRGRVALDGQPRDLFRLQVARRDGAPVDIPFDQLHLASGGTFAIAALPAGDYELSLLRQVRASLPGTIVSNHVPAGGASAFATVRAGAVTEVELTAPALALAGLHGQLREAAAFGPEAAIAAVHTGATNALCGITALDGSGGFAFADLPPGRYRLAVATSARALLQALPGVLETTVELAPGAVAEGSFALVRRSLQVDLTEPDGAPLAPCVLMLRCAGLERHAVWRGELRLDPAPDLPFEVRRLPYGAWSQPIAVPTAAGEHRLKLAVPR